MKLIERTAHVDIIASRNLFDDHLTGHLSLSSYKQRVVFYSEEENVAEAVGIPSPHQGRDALGKRLAVIGDRIEEQRRESSSASEAEGNKG